MIARAIRSTIHVAMRTTAIQGKVRMVGVFSCRLNRARESTSLEESWARKPFCPYRLLRLAPGRWSGRGQKAKNPRARSGEVMVSALDRLRSGAIRVRDPKEANEFLLEVFQGTE